MSCLTQGYSPVKFARLSELKLKIISTRCKCVKFDYGKWLGIKEKKHTQRVGEARGPGESFFCKIPFVLLLALRKVVEIAGALTQTQRGIYLQYRPRISFTQEEIFV